MAAISAHIRAPVPVAVHRHASAVHSPAPLLKAAKVQAQVRYTKEPSGGDDLYTYMYDPPDGSKVSTVDHEVKEVDIKDLASSEQEFTVRHNGFQLEKLHVDPSIEWTNSEQVQESYYPLVKELIKRVLGASRVHIFDHTVRKGKAKTDLEKLSGAEKSRQPVSQVHVDYTAESGPHRLRTALPDEAATLSKTPYAIIQIWRPLRGPVDESPLAMIDASSVSSQDLISHRIEFPGRTGHTYGVKYNPAHRWWYKKGMDTDEAYVFVCYDSRDDRAQFTPHTGFRDPTTRPDAPPRESVETRAFAFWEDGALQP